MDDPYSLDSSFETSRSEPVSLSGSGRVNISWWYQQTSETCLFDKSAVFSLPVVKMEISF